MKGIVWGLMVLVLLVTGQYVYAESLQVQVLTRPGKPYSATPAFSGYASATLTEPWVMCDQCLLVIHTPSDEAMPPAPAADNWHVRIITDNKSLCPNMRGKILVDPDGIPYNGDETLSYNGLIDPAVEAAFSYENPENRALVVWEVWEATSTHPYGITPFGVDLDQDALEDSLYDLSIQFGYWAYLCDANDTGFAANPTDGYFNILNGVLFAGGVPKIALAGYPPGAWDTRWVEEDIDSKFRTVIYLGACLGRNLADPAGGLPAGSYGTQMYVQLYHE